MAVETEAREEDEFEDQQAELEAIGNPILMQVVPDQLDKNHLAEKDELIQQIQGILRSPDDSLGESDPRSELNFKVKDWLLVESDEEVRDEPEAIELTEAGELVLVVEDHKDMRNMVATNIRVPTHTHIYIYI